MVTDDVFVQAKTYPALQELIDIAVVWQRDRKAFWSTPKCSYLQREKGKGERTSNNQRNEAERGDIRIWYLGVTIQEEGLKNTKSTKGTEGGGKDMSILIGQR